MAEKWLERARTGVVILASALLAVAPGFAAAQPQTGSAQTSSESKPADQSAASAGQQPAGESSRPAPQSAGEVGDRLHDSAKGFGEAILGGIKYAGRKVINFFND